jgi:hypothetical protein
MGQSYVGQGGINLSFASISDAANSSRRSQQYKHWKLIVAQWANMYMYVDPKRIYIPTGM